MTKRELDIHIGQFIKRERTARNLSVEDVVSALGISASYLLQIEAGRRGITIHRLYYLVAMFDMSLEVFFRVMAITPLKNGSDYL